MPITKIDKKKNGLQGYRVRVNENIDGKQRRIERIVYGLSEAQLVEKKLQMEIKKDPLTGLTVKGLMEMCLESKKNELRASSIDKTRRRLNTSVIPYLGDFKVAELNTRILQQWKDDMYKRDVKVSTMNGYYKEFNSILNFGVKMQIIETNQLKLLGTFKDQDFTPSEGKLKYYTVDEFKKFEAVSEAKAIDLAKKGIHLFFLIAFYTGMRKGEINALKWSDIDGDIINVRRSVNQKLGVGDVFTLPKNKSSYRAIKCPVKLVLALKEYQLLCKSVPGYTDDFFVCGGTRPIRDTTIANWNKKCSAEAELHTLRIHDFRHSHASLLCNAGINIQEVARRLGHSNVQMTWNIYSHMYPREEDRAVEVLNAI